MGEPLTNLIQLYRIEQETLVAHQQEVERRRAAVRAAAEREASEIVVTTRREVRSVLLRARQELVTLTAQVRAAGCEPASGERGDLADAARRDIRTVLHDARSELAELRQGAPQLTAAAAEPQRAADVWSAPPRDESDVAEDSSERLNAARLVEQVTEHWRIALVAAVVLVFVVTMIVSLRPSSTADAESGSRSSTATSAPQDTNSKPAAADQGSLNATATRGSDVRAPKPASASGVTAGTKPDAPATATAAKRGAPPNQAAEAPKLAATTPDQADATAERDILARHQQWFAAFDRGDRAAMASLASDNFSIVDERPARAPGVSGRIRDVRVRVNGIGAVLSGQIAEKASAGEAVHVAMLSEVWIKREERWQLVSVRMVPLDAVPKTLQ